MPLTVKSILRCITKNFKSWRKFINIYSRLCLLGRGLFIFRINLKKPQKTSLAGIRQTAREIIVMTTREGTSPNLSLYFI